MQNNLFLPISIPSRRRGVVGVVAMLFLVILVTLSVGMYSMATLNAQSAANLGDVEKARSLAESGLRWTAWRFTLPSNRPRTTRGNIDEPYALGTLWPQIRDAIYDDLRTLPAGVAQSVTATPGGVYANGLKLDGSGGTVDLSIESRGDYATTAGDEHYRHLITVRAESRFGTGGGREVMRSATMEFAVDKRIDFAVVSKTRIQLGRNVLVEGPVGMGQKNKFSPYLILSDFRHLDDDLADRVDDWEAWLDAHHDGYDNRVALHSPIGASAVDDGFADYDGDAFIDDFDLFLAHFDDDGDGVVDPAAGEFRDNATGGPLDPDLFHALDHLGGPLYDGDVTRAGYDDGVIGRDDNYAKIRGQVTLRDEADDWEGWLDGRRMGGVRDQMRGPIVTDGDAPVQFGAAASDLIDLDPANFEGASDNFRNRSGTAAGTPGRAQRVALEDGKEIWVKRRGDDAGQTFLADRGSAAATGGSYGDWDVMTETSTVENAVLSLDDASYTLAGGQSGGALQARRSEERTPFGSTSYQATYDRPVFRNMTLRNVQIPKGMNALFENCTFEGVTYVDMERDIDHNGRTRHDSGSGGAWSRTMYSGRFDKGEVITPANNQGAALGNNIRFHNCTFEGPLAAGYATAYTHFSNSWEFTGETLFDNKADATATIVAPNTNIEMGSFRAPTEAPSTLVGVVVAGNIDIRGRSTVDGSVIVVGDGAGNTTLGYFGPSDSDTTPSALPEGGFGRLNIRHNPLRALPDGIDLPVIIEPKPHTYTEGP